ncbi:MAG: NADH oxidase, partial [Roseicyclus sp.]|nr:NADH oxidase [Roseicyclus sp.]
YAVTRAAELGELDRVQALAARIGKGEVITILAAADDDHPRKGFVTDHLTADDLNAGDVDVYLCGPPPMVDAVRAHFGTLGIEPANFFYEKFNPTEAEAAAA